jgi:uncharacterized protein (DUF1330 family)
VVYALNLFNLIPGAEAEYREYLKGASPIIQEVGGRLLCAGSPPVRHITTDSQQRDRLLVVAFPDVNAFQLFMSRAKGGGLHPLRTASTRDYIWTLFEPWDLRTWMSS